MTRLCWIVLAGVLGSRSFVAADDGVPEEKLQALKAATVYVKVEGKRNDGTGSGFLIHVDGTTGLIATNRHVAYAGRSRSTSNKYSIVFWSGTKKEQIYPGELIAVDPDEDLAILKVAAQNLPAPLDLAPTKLRETMTVYTLGFPLGEVLATDRPNPAVTIGKGTIASLRENSQGKLDSVQLDGELNPGNSGGPVVDVNGKLVGVVVSKIVGTKISFAIPAAELNGMLRGRAAGVLFQRASVSDGEAEVELEIPLVDPFQKIKKVEIRHVRKDALKEAPKVGNDGRWIDLAGAQSAPVKIENNKAIARITLRSPDKKPHDWYFQSAFALDDGKLAGTRPVEQTIHFGKDGVTRLDGAPPWQTIVSKEGGFTIDMPAKPVINEANAERIGGVAVKSFILGCVTDNGVYLAHRVSFSSGLTKGADEKLLDALRDFFAEEWNGKVVTEKRVRNQFTSGRDFTIVGKPDKKETVAIRVRQFLVGQSIIAVIVISFDRAMPEDAGRFLGSLALGEAHTRATGTPEPEQKGTALKDWGVAIDPDKDCKITPGDGKSIAFVVPGKLHDLYFDGGPTNAPRVMQEVEGDFVATIKVCGEFKPVPKSTNPKSVPFHGAGFLLWSDSDNNLRFERYSWLRGGQYNTGALFEEREGGYAGATHTEQFKPGDCHLRIERKGSRIVGSISSDGQNWKDLKPLDTVWPAKLKIGLTAITTSSQPFSVKFEEFVLKRKP